MNRRVKIIKICNYDSSRRTTLNLQCETSNSHLFPLPPASKPRIPRYSRIFHWAWKSASCKRKNHYCEQRRQQQVAALPWRAILFSRVSRQITGRVKLLLLQTRVTNKRHPGMCDEIDSINTSNYRVYLAPHTQCNFELCASHLPIISLPLPLSFSSWHGIKIDSIFLPSFRPMISRLITSDAYLKSNLILSFPSQALFHPNNPSDSMTKSWKSFIQRNSSDLKALNRRLAVAILKRFLSTRADTLPRPPIVLTEKEEEEEESIGCRGSEEKRGKGGRDQQGETKEWRTAVDELCKVPSLLHSFSSSPPLSPRPVPFHPLNPTQKASLSAATPASFRRLITYARERPAQAYESSRWRWAKPSE